LVDPARKLEEVLRSRLPGRPGVERGPRPDDLTVRLGSADDVPAAVSELTSAGLALATLVATDEEGTRDRDLKIRYVFEPVAMGGPPLPDLFVTLVASVDPARPEVPSISAQVPAASWHEREAQDLLGIAFGGHPDPRPLVVHDGWPKGLHPLRKAFDGKQRRPVEPAEEFPHLVVEGEGVLEVPVGPIHAGIIEPGHFRFSTVGERVLNLEARLFYTHRGIEKRIEGLLLDDAFHVAERTCGVCSVSHALGFCEAAERIAGVEVPRRARVLRTIALELERLYNHVGDVGNIGAGASYHYGTSAGARMKEALQQLNEQVTGHRFLRGLVAPGGVRQDLRPELARAIEKAMGATAEALDSLVERLEANPSVTDRLDGTGVLPAIDAVALGVTGVAARASGVDRDARRDHPHAAYGSDRGLSPSVATEKDGDVHARLNVRVAEAREAIRLVRVGLAALPQGPVRAALPDALPPFGIGLSAIESPRGAAIHWLRSDAAGRVDRWHLRSASYANWPAVPLAALSAIVPDFPLVNKSFELCYSCTDR
jgi:Ni,Fe-hydrogenase III large subunit/Ni,Fe-hydrogenase III component G